MRIKKIRVDKLNRINIEYEIERPDSDPDEFSFTCADKALPSFYIAFQALFLDVIEMCEIPRSSNISIKGISFSFSGEKEVMGCVLTAQKTLLNSDSPLNLNTPHKISEFYGETGSKKQLLSDDCKKRLNDIIYEAIRFVNGERLQKDMFREAKPFKWNE